MDSITKVEADLRDMGRVAQDMMDLASVALRDPLNEPISEKIMATINAAEDVLVRVDMSQWGVAKPDDKRRAHASAADHLAVLNQSVGWMKTAGTSVHASHRT